MTDAVTEVFKKYGWRAFAIAALVAIIIWGAAHLAAKPDTQVSVLWGLVSYTKPPVQEPALKTEISAQEYTVSDQRGAPQVAAQDDRPSLALTVEHGVTTESYESFMTEYRDSHSLRELRPLESGTEIGAVPNNTYLFVLAPWLDYPNWSVDSVLALEVSRTRPSREAYFEIHRTSDDLFFLLGFVTETDAGVIQRLNGRDTHFSIISPIPWDSFTSLIVVPIERIDASKSREIDRGTERSLEVLELTIR